MVVCVLLSLVAVRRLMTDSRAAGESRVADETQVADEQTTTTRHTPPAEPTPNEVGDQVDVQEVLQSVVGPLESSGNLSGLLDALETGADVNRTVMISVVDVKYTDFALNFYSTATRLGLPSVLVCVDEDATRYLAAKRVPCVPFYVKHAIGGGGMYNTVHYCFSR